MLEAKLILRENVVVSVMTEFVDNEGKELEKQDCERKAADRLLKKLKQAFPRQNFCISADSLYACEGILEQCRKNGGKYLIRFKAGSIPGIYEEYESLKKYTEKENHRREIRNGKEVSWNHVEGIDYRGYGVNVAEYREKAGRKETQFYFITDLPIKKGKAVEIAEYGRRRWKIENEGFNTQKKQGYHLEHRYSHSYQGTKTHYYLIRIGHMISQILEAYEALWKGIRQSKEQKHRRILENFKSICLSEYQEELERR